MPKIDFAAEWLSRRSDFLNWQSRFSAETLSEWFESRDRHLRKQRLFAPEEFETLHFWSRHAPEYRAIVALQREKIRVLKEDYFVPRKSTLIKARDAVLRARKLELRDVRGSSGGERATKVRQRAAIMDSFAERMINLEGQIQEDIVNAIYDGRRTSALYGIRVEDYYSEVYPYLRNEISIEELAIEFLGSARVKRVVERVLS